MSKSVVKPKATIIWNEQTEKLKKTILNDLDNLKGGKIEEMLSRLQRKVSNSEHKLYHMKM
ncbi:MAG: hypothetical protein ACM3RX_05925 [Methanococcaceae archaeon]